jgi:hypothetical protein
METIISFIFFVIIGISCFLILRKQSKLEDMLKKLTVAGEEIFNDNELNTVFIQKALDTLSEAGYEPDISVDENGQRWITAKVAENTNVNTIKLSKELFQSKNFGPIEKILKNEINEVLPSFVEKIKGEQNAKN